MDRRSIEVRKGNIFYKKYFLNVLSDEYRNFVLNCCFNMKSPIYGMFIYTKPIVKIYLFRFCSLLALLQVYAKINEWSFIHQLFFWLCSFVAKGIWTTFFLLIFFQFFIIKQDAFVFFFLFLAVLGVRVI